MTVIARRELGSTYRVQLNGLGFAGARAMVPFLHQLGVETMYVSPVTQARSASTHGYDVIDPTRLDPALGTAADFEQLLAGLDERGMGLLVDIVPNHMAASTESPFFADVLRVGQGSLFARWFDIAWADQDGRFCCQSSATRFRRYWIEASFGLCSRVSHRSAASPTSTSGFR